jgi:acetoin:2,6-dichlorophenolindophenol oxidoreductase subunit alpha
MKISKNEKIEMFRKMLLIRAFEQKTQDLYARGLIPGLAHLYIGEEAIAVGVCTNLRDGDYITSTHRGHGHVLAKGADPKYMFSELLGKKNGYCKGKGGSMHIADVALGILGANGIAGGGIPIACGSGFSSKFRRTDQVTVCFFGDGAANTGSFHEGVNFASVKKLPVIFICENNLYSISIHVKESFLVKNISIRTGGYGIPGVTVDGNDVLAIYEATREAMNRARSGEGPTLIECLTYRWRGHHEGDPNQGTRYRTKEEIEEWMKKCPIKRFEDILLQDGTVSANEIDKLKKEVLEEIEDSVKFAMESPFPEKEDLYADVYI